ncbi:histidinol-phosphatase [Thiolapillus brandeum]|uniref:Histidinol-phosphatase n=1 Tax=Thiolapillus brandeum TaxID=1076588 RepID=A0A7U6JHZ9_9GAMM|nr:HAD family hydrolase [Thiolapillus brandeum]BAO43735.1 hydrolase HAD family [Thiolapillus brandeum]
MALVLFDLDNTLLAGDSDYLWGQFLGEQGLVDKDFHAAENERFYREYQEGNLDILEFLAFSLKPLSERPMDELQVLHRQFMKDKIDPIITPEARMLVDMHRRRGDQLLIITATNAFVTAPIAAAFGIDELIATEPEIRDGRYTGRVAGVPCFREGKVERLQAWLQEHDQNLGNAWFYSDSHNDLPLLEKVTHPIPVDPDEALSRVAEARGWPVLNLHHAPSPEK